MVLYGLLSGQILFGAAAVVAVALKHDGRPAPAMDATRMAASMDAGAVVR
jgi:ABC-type uncharacterized transport system permease subunit